MDRVDSIAQFAQIQRRSRRVRERLIRWPGRTLAGRLRWCCACYMGVTLRASHCAASPGPTAPSCSRPICRPSLDGGCRAKVDRGMTILPRAGVSCRGHVVYKVDCNVIALSDSESHNVCNSMQMRRPGRRRSGRSAGLGFVAAWLVTIMTCRS